MAGTNETTGVNRLFILEQNLAHPLDQAVSEGRHELRDCGVELNFDGDQVSLAWQGYGPSAFVLPGARQLRKGTWTRVEQGARVSWAGRDWIFVPHVLPGDGKAPIRGVSLNKGGTGFPTNAVLLVVEGKDRGNFYRFRTEPGEVAPEVTFHAHKTEGGHELRLTVRRGAGAERVRIDGQVIAPDTTVTLEADQTISIEAHDRGAAITVLVIEA